MKCQHCKLYEADVVSNNVPLCSNCAGLEWMDEMEKAQTTVRAYVNGIEYDLESLLGESESDEGYTLAQHIEDLKENHSIKEIVELISGSKWWVGNYCNPPQSIAIEVE